MANPTLDEHQARVERAEKTLRDDLQQLAQHGRKFKQQFGMGKMLLLCGGAVVLGVLGVRAAYRRRRPVVVRARVRPQSPSLLGTAVRMVLLEAARHAATRLMHRFVGVFEPHQAPELPDPPLARAGGIQRSDH
jgi:hypothetical protein